MNKTIYLLTDYKGFFGSKQISQIYRGGMNVPLIITLFRKLGYAASAMPISQLNSIELKKENPIVLYTSSEDKESLYKSFIEDIVYHLEDQGIFVIPRFAYIMAHNNKVAMELLRNRANFSPIQTIRSKVFGTFEELVKNAETFKFPVVLKTATGAMSKGVTKAENYIELIKIARKYMRSLDPLHDMKELFRKLKYRSKYNKESFYRSKIVVQNLIQGLENDWKVLVYGNKCYVLYRGNRKNDFRASGSGDFVFRKELPKGILDFAYSIKEHFNVPHISLDIGFDGKNFHLIEFQFLYFGTTTVEKSPFYFVRVDNKWLLKEEQSDLESIYVGSIVDFLIKKSK